MGFGLAVKAFFTVLTNKEMAQRFLDDFTSKPLLLDNSRLEKQTEETERLFSSKQEQNKRSEAVELLATLQREARFVDFIKEDITTCDDTTLGAAVRGVHDRCAEVLERCFAIRSLSDKREGETITLSEKEMENLSRIQMVRNCSVISQVVTGIILHMGWQATRCSLPQWSGNEDDRNIIAPIEVEN